MALDLALNEQDAMRRFFDLGYFRGKEWDEVRAFVTSAPQVKLAVEEYRDFHGLPGGDKIDEPLITQLFLPRCGLPDLVRPEEAALCQWSFPDVTCAMALAGLQPLATDVEQRLYAQALQNWNEVCGLNLTLIQSMDTANIYSQIGNMGGGTLAWSYLPCSQTDKSTRLQQQYNKATNWTEALLLQTIIHEIGHALGLDHGPKGSVMQPTSSGTILRPQSWDIAQVQLRYGKPKPPPPGPPQPPPPSGQRLVLTSPLPAGEYEIVPAGSSWDMAPKSGTLGVVAPSVPDTSI